MRQVHAGLRVLITSDTHVTDASALPSGLLDAALHADHIVHAGDLSVIEVVDVLQRFAPVTAVSGNIELASVPARLPAEAVAIVGECSIGVVHDAGPASGRHERLHARFPDCDVVVYGHSHMPEISSTADGLVVVNPGSPTQRRRAPFHTFAWLTVPADGTPVAELVQL